MSEVTASCKLGKICGEELDGVMAFRGVPYAQDGGRFERCLPAEPWSGILDSRQLSPVFPQANRAISVNYRGELTEIPQAEDAFRLSIWTPDLNGALPVMFWIHGGGYTSGGCGFPCYDGSCIARNQNVVFVGVNYRLGVLGNLHIPGFCEDNLAILDLIEAFSWVRSNIEAFGGDPENITIVGQSAGAAYALSLAGQEKLAGEFSKLALLSIPGSQPLTPQDAGDLASAFMRHLKVDDPDQLRDKPLKKVIDAQHRAERESKNFGVGFMPCTDGKTLGEDMFAQASQVSGSKVPLLDGITLQETAFFLLGMREKILTMESGQVLQLLGGFGCGNPRSTWDRLGEKYPEDDQFQRVVRATSASLFHEAGDKVCSDFSTAYAYRMDYSSKVPWLGACHCIDLPFMFGDFENWADDPMMQGSDFKEMTPISKSFQAGFGAFARTGSPECDETGSWDRAGTNGFRKIFG
ncbi:MAG: carboxylesterase family protein [Coriobacteriales bacterium]|jgi:para-nitrobenzyl esterase